MITTLFHPVTRPATGEMGEGRGKGGGTTTLAGGSGRAGRLQASDPREAFHARPQVSCLQGSGFRFRFGVSASGFRFLVQGARS